LIFTDFLERHISLKSIPKRIVSLVPSQTELLVDLGLRDQIVGVTKFCVHPKNLRKEKTVVGGTKQVKIQKIKSLKPEIILCNKEENTREIVTELEQIAAVHVSEIKSLDDNNRLIRDYGKLFGVEEKAKELVFIIEEEKSQFQSLISDKSKLKIAYLIWRDPWMAVGRDTFINHLLEVCNFDNVFKDKERYPEIDINNLPELDLVLLSSEPYPFKTIHLDDIPIPNENIRFVNGEYFSWYGSRMRYAFDYFKDLLDSR
jgi:ABC-type Fe3+-hydroxamate transport system substrate-binding protein